MTQSFFDRPIINSPYAYPGQHWELDESGQPTDQIVEHRRLAEFITPIPKPKKQKKHAQGELVYGEAAGLSTDGQQYTRTAESINRVRELVDKWRVSPTDQWGVTPTTARLLQHWRSHAFAGVRPFFCQVEAAETAIWLSEVAHQSKAGQGILEYLRTASVTANPFTTAPSGTDVDTAKGLDRVALKLATGSGKTTVMAMLIAWQTVNAVRSPNSRRFTRGFLVVTPGLTIRDRLRVLLPNDPDSYYKGRELVPNDMLGDLGRAQIVITNYHAFRRRETVELAAGNRALLQGRGPELQTTESPGQMLQRVMPGLMGLKGVMVLNDEAHHCYREKPAGTEEAAADDLTGDDREQAERNKKAARLWISGLEAVADKLKITRVFDLSATPFFISGSGYLEGTLFPWTASDFSLMDAIECGIVKLPRVPVADNIPGAEVPVYRELWKHVGKKLPRKGRKSAASLDPLGLPPVLQTALEALYGHYAATFEAWRAKDIAVPPCLIIVCQNTTISKLVYDYVSGFDQPGPDGTTTYKPGKFKLFRNADEYGQAYACPRTLLIDSEQLESGEALDDTFRKAAGTEIEQFRREIRERTGDLRAADAVDDSDLLREVMNTVGKAGKLGEQIRCVVSVSMLTEGWDANNVTHILGVRAFGTQLLCEQVIGRALRRQSYDLNEDGLFNPEYADILGIPFDFTAKPVVAPPQPPRETVHVKAVRPDRDALEITFPRVAGYRTELPTEQLTAHFTDDSTLELTPDLVGPSIVQNAGIIGREVELNVKHLADVRQSTLLFHLTQRLLETKWRDPGEEPKLHLFGQLKRIARQWLDHHLICKGDTYPALLMYQALADIACERITAGITRALIGDYPVRAVLETYNPIGSTAAVSFNTSKTDRWKTAPDKCHINWVILDSDWEAQFCLVAEKHPRVRRYVKNHNLGFEVPYRYGPETRHYRPDFIVVVDDGHGADNLLNLIVEIKGYRGEDAKDKKSTMDTYWVPGVNNLCTSGRWAFAEFTDVFQIGTDFETAIGEHFDRMIETVCQATPTDPVGVPADV